MSAGSVEQIMKALQERAKELACLYRVEEILRAPDRPLPELLQAVVDALPPGWQFPAICQARVQVREVEVASAAWADVRRALSAPLVVRGERVGEVGVGYTQAMPDGDEGPFLREERRLLDTVAERLSQTLLHTELTALFGRLEAGASAVAPRQAFRTVVDLIRRSDHNLYRRVSRRLLNHLSCAGVQEAQQLLASLSRSDGGPEDNQPLGPVAPEAVEKVAAQTFDIAERHREDGELLLSIQGWIREDRVNFLLQALESSDTAVPDIAAALERYQHTGIASRDLTPATLLGLRVSLVRRLLSDHQELIEPCRRWVEVEDFVDLLEHTVRLPRSHGKLGGKAAGLFLARQVLRRCQEPSLADVKFPRTWYLPSDGVVQFIGHNDLDDVYNWKYREIDQIRQEYPHLQQVFRDSRFPPEMVTGLATVLDELGPRPLIVRSSSLLEDRAGSAFSGKYKSLFLGNQGRREHRLAALLAAVAEVYASVFSPDPIQYRAQRGLLEYHEEMGIIIQEVVGERMGRWFLPSWSGVGFSRNELRWSPRIRRDDGLLRIVPGLGTRAVDRLGDDYPVLVAPGQPQLRVNVGPEEVHRYSPRKLDVIDLEGNAFATVDRHPFLAQVGALLPQAHLLLSVFEGDRMRRLGVRDMDFQRDDHVFTFEGLLRDTPFLARMKTLLRVLEQALGRPVDIEFAGMGQELWLVQCRPQSHNEASAPAVIPRDVPREQVLFTAHKYVSNGVVSDISHVVYVDPDGYAGLAANALRDVGRAVGALNKALPRRRFILIGPGRWGSRGDMRLGVSVTYADISNTAMLVEVARKRGNYLPDLSFGTHFFQDLVESAIRYLPLYPDDPGSVFNEAFFTQSENQLAAVAPEFADLAHVVRVIDVPASRGGALLRVLMNGDEETAIALLASA